MSARGGGATAPSEKLVVLGEVEGAPGGLEGFAESSWWWGNQAMGGGGGRAPSCTQTSPPSLLLLMKHFGDER